MLKHRYCNLTSGHDYEYVRAEDYESAEDSEYQTSEGVPIAGCHLVDECTYCGSERRVYAPITIAKKHDVPFEWEKD